MNYLVLDTNILLLDAYNVVNIAKKQPVPTTIVLPETVLDEIDSKKSGTSEIAYQARQFTRLLSKATRSPVGINGALIINVLELEGVPIWICALSGYPNFSDFEANIRSDRKILHVADILSRKYPNVAFCSVDGMCSLRAEAMGLQIYEHKLVDNTDIKFTHSLSVDSSLFSSLEGMPITTINPAHKLEYYNYMFTDTTSGQVRLGYIQSGVVRLITKDVEDELRKQEAPPLNSGQLFFSEAILRPSNDIIICEALSGSGKTVTALSNAMKLVSTNSPFKNILYIRNTVDDIGERDEEIGFLSGNDEKVKGYLYPFYDTVESMVRHKLKTSKLKGKEFEEKVAESIVDMIDKYHMTAITAMHMRGRTFNDSIVIIDEAQNMSKATLQKVLTRIGKNCKVIIIGSLKQIDSKYINKYTAGLAVLLDACAKPNTGINLVGTTLERVVRGPITEWAEKLFSNQNK